MPDYGHDLEFGTFITPQNQRPEDVVALAQLTERAGLDLATFQDHPYQAAFLDTWTLLSWVAAQTDDAARGAERPQPAAAPARRARARRREPRPALRRARRARPRRRRVLGRDRGDGRPAAHAGRGRRRAERGDRRHPRHLGRAERGGVRVARRALPRRAAPSAARRPRTTSGSGSAPTSRACCGSPARKADGWLPSLPYLQPEDIAPATRTIDEAALRRRPRPARDPAAAQHRRATAATWVEQLLPLVLEHGFSTFILAGDDPRAIQRFGQEVAPALREAVARERGDAGTPTGPVRGAGGAGAARARGSTTTRVPASLATAVEPGDRDYAKVRSTYIRSGSPGPGDPGRRTRPTSSRRSRSRARRTCRWRCAAAATASAAARPTTAASSSTSARSNGIERARPGDRRVRLGPGRALGRRRAGARAARARR